MPKVSQQERRKYGRAKRILSIKHRLYKRGTKTFTDKSWNWHLSSTKDMSLGGILFTSNVPYQLNDVIELEVVISGALDVFNGYGKIIRISPAKSGAVFDTAIKFCGLKERKKKRPGACCS